MSDGIVPRLQAVGPSPGGRGVGDIPVEIIRFATLPEDRRALLIQVSDLLDQIAFGTVVIVIHEGNVTQIETSEKIRLPSGSSSEG
jgi:hypothetical protein